MINDGISAELCLPDASCQKRHPHFQSNARGVRKMLSSVLHPEHIHAVLSRSIPTPLKMPHHPSAAEHHDDIDASVQGMLASGVLLNVHDLGFSAEQCRYYVDHCLLTTGLGYVYRQSNGKGRPIWDRYLNKFVKYIPGLKYDTLEMFQALLQPGDYLVGMDQRARTSTSSCTRPCGGFWAWSGRVSSTWLRYCHLAYRWHAWQSLI